MRRFEWSPRVEPAAALEPLRIRWKKGPLHERHCHAFPEVFWLDAGRCSHWINGADQVLQTGQLVFIRADDCHQLVAHRGSCTLCNVTLNPSFTDDFAQRHPEAFSWCFHHGHAEPRIIDLSAGDLGVVRGWFAELTMQAPSRLRLEGFLLDLFRLVLPRDPAVTIAGVPEWLCDALAELRAPEVFRRGVPGFVHAAQRSHEHVARACRSHLGKRPSELVADARLDYATRLLRLTDQSVLDVAMDAGFGSVAQFYRQFTRRFGAPPAELRRVWADRQRSG